MPILENNKIILCDNCFKICGKTRCSGCNVTYYCDAKCQTAHWTAHKADCKTLGAQYQVKDSLKTTLIEFLEKNADASAVSVADKKEPQRTTVDELLKTTDRARIVRFINTALSREMFDRITVVKLTDQQQKNLNDLKVNVQLEFVANITRPDDILAVHLKPAGKAVTVVELSDVLEKLDTDYIFFQYKFTSPAIDEMDLIRL